MLQGGLATAGIGPPFGRELADKALWMRGDPKEHVLQVVERWDIDELAALHEGIEKRGPTRALQAAGKEPVLPAHRDDTELVLGAGMPPTGLCRLSGAGARIERIPRRSIVADAA